MHPSTDLTCDRATADVIPCIVLAPNSIQSVLDTSFFQFDGFLLAKLLFTLCLCGDTHSEGGATGVTWDEGNTGH